MKAQAKIGVHSLCLRAGLLLGAFLFLGTSLLLPQSNLETGKDKTPLKSPDTKADKDKAAVKPPDAKTDKDKTPAKLPETKTDSSKTAEPSKPAASPGRTVEMSEKEYQELKKKGERKSVDLCRLTGELKDHVMFFEAEFRFETNLPNMVVPLGLQRSFPIDPKGLDGQKLAELGLALRGEEDGYVLDVAKAGKYDVTLHLKVPVGLRRAGDKGGSERGFVLGLPAAPSTELLLKLPQEIKELRSRRKAPDETAKELRWYDPEPEKFMQAGRWWLTPGTARMIDVFWKERDAGVPPQANVKINVNLEESQSVVTAEMLLEDPRGEAKEWQLFLPYRTDDVKMIRAPAGSSWKIVRPPPDSKGQPYVVRFQEPTSEPFAVKAEVRVRKEPGGLPVGPFYAQVPGANVSQQGSIVVQAALGRGQFLDFKANDWVHRTEIPKGPAWQDVKAAFEYGNFPPQLKANDPKIPLEIKWRTDKGSGEASVEHLLKLKLRPAGGLQIDLQTQIKIKSLSGGDYLDVQLPRSPPKLSLFALFPAAGFPGGVPLGAFAELLPTGPVQAEPIEKFSLLDEDGNTATLTAPDGSGKVPDASGKVRIKFVAPVSKEVTQTLVGRYFVPAGPDGVQKFLIDLPRPLGIVDRGGKVWARSEDEKIEFLMGPPRADFKTDWDSTFPPVELTWRPYHPQYLVQNVVDVKLRGKEAHLRQHLTLTWTPRPGGPEVPRTDIVALRLPRNRNSLKISGGGEEINPQSDQDIVWVKMTGAELPLVVDFYQPLPDAADEPWKVPLVTPEGTTAVEANVRIWCEPGVQPEAVKMGERWQDRGPEVVRGNAFPALVLFGSGPPLDLTLRLRAASGISLPVMVCDKALVEASVDEDGTHRYRARYVMQKLYVNRLRVRFPASAATCNPRVTLDGNPIQWEPDAADRNVAVLKIDPEIVRALMEGKGQGGGVKLFLDYKVPANSAENGTHWQTTLTGPVFLGDVFLGRVRWLVHMPANWVSVVAANNVHPDFRWTLQTYLLAPEPVVSAAELAEWRQGWDESLRDEPSLVFSRRSQESFAVVHFQKQIWLALCSGLLLALGLALHLLPMSRSIFWLILVTVVAGMIVGGFLWPAWVPALLFGAQPGAVVLALILVIHWVLKERYRRQVIFMPGFTRLKPGSSLLHTSPVSRPREASTVDAPAPAGRGSNAQHNPPG